MSCKEKEACKFYGKHNFCDDNKVNSCGSYESKDGYVNPLGYTHSQYLNKEIGHREYFAQFVNEGIKGDVASYIGLEALLRSSDKHLNDIPLENWRIMPFRVNSKKMEELEHGYSKAFQTCVLKEAAKQIIENT